MAVKALSEKLSKYIPANAAAACADIIVQHRVRVKLTRSRQSKFGDFRPPHNGLPPQITINHNLNPYAFLITLLHEIAHLFAHQKYGNNVLPHGWQWKKEFANILEDFHCHTIFPEDVLLALRQYIENPKASGCTDNQLFRSLRKYDADVKTFLEDLPEGSRFKLGSGKIMIKGRKLKKRFSCIEVRTNYLYYVSAVAEVEHVE